MMRVMAGNAATYYEGIRDNPSTNKSDRKYASNRVKDYNYVYSESVKQSLKSLNKYKNIEDKIIKQYGNVKISDIVRNNSLIDQRTKDAINFVEDKKHIYRDSPYNRK